MLRSMSAHGMVPVRADDATRALGWYPDVV
jgi:hypothetical protein